MPSVARQDFGQPLAIGVIGAPGRPGGEVIASGQSGSAARAAPASTRVREQRRLPEPIICRLPCRRNFITQILPQASDVSQRRLSIAQENFCHTGRLAGRALCQLARGERCEREAMRTCASHGGRRDGTSTHPEADLGARRGGIPAVRRTLRTRSFRASSGRAGASGRKGWQRQHVRGQAPSSTSPGTGTSTRRSSAQSCCGILLGHFYPEIGEAMKPLGDAFIKLIKMLIAPIIFCTVVHGIASMEDMKKVGRVGVKALIYFEVDDHDRADHRARRGQRLAARRGHEHRSGRARHQRRSPPTPPRPASRARSSSSCTSSRPPSSAPSPRARSCRCCCSRCCSPSRCTGSASAASRCSTSSTRPRTSSSASSASS